MSRWPLKNLRWQLSLLILLGAVPTTGLVVYTAIETRQQQVADTRSNLQRLARVAAAEHVHRIQAAHELLFTLSDHSGMLGRAECERALAEFARESSGYLNLGLFRTDGTGICVSRRVRALPDFSSTRWFRQVLRTGDLVIGAYDVHSQMNAPVLRIAHPLKVAGAIEGVLVAALDFAWVGRLPDVAQIPETGVLTVVMPQGEVLARYPATARTEWGVPKLLMQDIVSHGSGTLECPDGAGVRTLYAFEPLVSAIEGPAWVIASLPSSSAYASADARLWRNLGLLAALCIVSFIAAEAALQRFTLRPIEALLRATRRIAVGDLGARSGVSPGFGEVGQLAASFDRMAASLESQQHELRASAARLSTVVDQSLVGVYVTRADTILYANEAGARIVGCRPGDLIGRSPLSMIHPDDVEMVSRIIHERTDVAPQGVRYTFRVARVDGTYAVCETFGRRIEYEGVPAILGTMLDVTDREAAAEALRVSESRFRAVFEQASAGMALLGDKQIILDGNAALLRMTGYRAEELRGHSICELLLPGCHDEHNDFCPIEPQWDQAEHQLTRADGTRLWVSVTRSPMQADGNGGPRAVVSIEDISARKSAHEELVRLRLAVEATGEIVFITDRDGVIRFVNPEFTRVYGYTADEVLGRQTPRIIKSGLVSRDAYDAFWAAILRGEIVRSEFSNRTKDGRIVNIDGSANPIRDAAGEIVGFLAIQRDVTERRMAQNERDRLASVVEQMAESTTIFDEQERFVYVNPAFERLSGYRAADVLGHPLRLLASGEHDSNFYRTLWAHLRGGGTWTGQITHRRKDGSLYTEEATITPIRDRDGQVHHFVSVGQDVAERRSLEMQLRQSQKMEAIGRLAGGIAHDFNNLLTVILGQSEMLEPHLGSESGGRRHAEAIRAAADRASRLTRQLLAFSRRQQMSVRAVDPKELVDSIAAMLRRLIGEDISLRVVHARDLGAVRADPVQIEQVLMNLAVNARDAMPDGGTLTIETTNTVLDRDYADRHVGVTPGAYVQVTVTDTGHGMAEEVRSRIFEPFFTTKGPGKGTGLGLSTAFGIVKQHGGNIWVYSEPGLGTTFKIYLPRTDAKARAAMARAAEPPPVGTETILLVEDDEGVRELLTESIAQYGYRVLSSPGGADAEKQLRRHPGPVDLMLTDVVMPGMNGPELYERLAPQRPDMRVLFMSGYTDLTALQTNLIDERSSFIAKPFTHSDLARKIRAVLDAGAPTETESR